MKMNLSNNITVIQNLVTEYLSLKLELVKLSVLEKITKITIFLTSLMVIILAINIFIIFASAAFIVWYGANYQDYLTGLLIVMGFVVLMMVIFFLFRRTIFESFFLKTYSSILLEKENDD